VYSCPDLTNCSDWGIAAVGGAAVGGATVGGATVGGAAGGGGGAEAFCCSQASARSALAFVPPPAGTHFLSRLYRHIQ